MNRRRLLAAMAGLGAGLAGCAGTGERATETDTPSATATPIPVARLGNPPTICSTEVTNLGITAIVEPAFADDWSDVEDGPYDGSLDDDDVVVGVARGGEARAYPLSVLFGHEIVNDDLGGPLLVTYCPLCNSGMVAERRVGGEPTLFGVTGQLWLPPEVQTRRNEQEDRVFGVGDDGEDTTVQNQGNLVLYDEATGSYWSQLLTEAICGPRTGDRFAIVPSTVSTWGEWRAEHPDTEVLLPPPASVAENPPYPGTTPPEDG